MPFLPIFVVLGVAILLFGVLDGTDTPKQQPPKQLTPNTPTDPNVHSGLHEGDVLDTALGDQYDAHDVSGEAAGDAVFVFSDQAQKESADSVVYDYSAPADSFAGKNFRRLFLRHIFWPAQRVEPSRDISRGHVAAACAVLKGFTSNPRVSMYTDGGAPAVGAATTIVSQVMQGIPVGSLATSLFNVGLGEMTAAFNDLNQKWFDSWADLYKAPDPEDFLGPSGDGGNAEDPLPPVNVFGGGGGRVDAEWWFASGPAMWRNDQGHWEGGTPDPVFGTLPGTGTYVAGKGVVNTSPWILTDDEIPLDMKGKWRAGDKVFPRARLFSVAPTIGKMILPWRYIGGEATDIRTRINLIARVYRVIDLLACIKWYAYTPPSTATWTDPKLGLVRGSIFRATPLQSAGGLTAKAVAPTAIIGAIKALATPVQADSITVATPGDVTTEAVPPESIVQVAPIAPPPVSAPAPTWGDTMTTVGYAPTPPTVTTTAQPVVTASTAPAPVATTTAAPPEAIVAVTPTPAPAPAPTPTRTILKIGNTL